MNQPDFPRLGLFITGPTFVREDIRQAATLPEFGHRDKENDKRFGPAMANLKKLAGVDDSYKVVVFNGSGTTAMDASIRSLVRDDEKVLNVSVGAFGDLYHKLAVANGKNAVQLKFDYGRAMDMDELDKALAEHKPGVVTMTHNETSTGVVNDIAAACDLVREHGALPLVDGVSIFGGADLGLMKARPAMYSTSTQKSLALPAGFGIGFVNQEAIDKAGTVKVRGHISDILAHLPRSAKNQTQTTPNHALANQLYTQLEYIVNEEGIEQRFARHARMRDMVHAWVDGLNGFELYAQKGHRSPTLTTVRVPEGVSAADLKQVKEAMRARGYLYDPGYGKLNTALEERGDRCVFRVGHMGDITPDMLEKYLAELKEELEK